MTELNIQQRMLFVTRDCTNIEKKGYNSFSNYPYVRAVDVIEQVNKLLVKHGICLSILQEEVQRVAQGKNYISQVKCRAVFSNADSPTDQIVVTFYGIAADTLDKDLYKALTNGLKYLFTQQFLIVTDALNDAEDDSGKDMGQAPKMVSANPKQYVVGFGKFNGQRIVDIPSEDLCNYVDYILGKAKEDGKPITGKVKEFIDAAKALKGSK